MRKIQYSFIDEFGFATCKTLQNSIYFGCGVKAIVFAEILFLSAGVLALTAPLFFFFFFHSQNKISNFAETCQTRGGLFYRPSLELASYLEAHSEFPNLNSYFEGHTIKSLVGFFLLPFKRFRFLFRNSSFELHYKNTKQS